MKPQHLLAIFALGLAACNQPKPADQTAAATKPIIGTWKLVSDIVITKGDTAVNYPVKGQESEMLKIYNDTHFSFSQHDLKKGKVNPPFFSSGMGTYKLNGDDYAEQLIYCTDRVWEGHDFKFKLTIHNDTLIQRGVEKLDSLNINRDIVETYVKQR